MISSRKVIIMSGVSGSGKSTLASQLIQKHVGDVAPFRSMIDLIPGIPPRCVLVSADDYFLVPTEEPGKLRYEFNPRYLGHAHGTCFRHFVLALQNEFPLVVVDNTNTTNEELAPYIQAALAWNYTVEVVTVMCANLDDVKECASRNAHGAPESAVLAQAERLSTRIPPYHWRPEFGVTFTQVSPIFPSFYDLCSEPPPSTKPGAEEGSFYDDNEMYTHRS